MVNYYVYLNPTKVDSLFSQLKGEVVTEKKERSERGLEGTGKLGLEIGSILAMIGIGKGTGEVEVGSNYSKILEVSSTLSPENKANLLHEYYIKQRRVKAIALTSVTETSLTNSIESSSIQIITGGFSYHEFPKKDTDELWSERKQKDSKLPLVKIPVFREHLSKDQALNAWTDEDYFPIVALCQCLLTKKGILASPITIWWPDMTEGEE
ncbi:MAG TPA: hypothetical protein VM934_06275 [Pyrinomonadaceae bacterium]|jgi:hypothetical protein|nr:hypothetical protein [Pyrinomonadaceae bacterium]